MKLYNPYLSYVEGYRDENGVSRQKTIRKIGDWDELIKLYDDPIAHFNHLAKSSESKVNTIKIDTSEELGITNDYKNCTKLLAQWFATGS